MRVWGATDRGLVRQQNEDAFSHFVLSGAGGEEVYFFAVADGMGGLEAGEVASFIALRDIGRVVKEEPLGSSTDVPSLLVRAFCEANRRIYEVGCGRGSGSMGTTVTAGLVMGGTLYIGHVGDSRAYRFTGNSLEQLTEDHSLVGQMVRNGEITETEAMGHPRRNILTHALGARPECLVQRVEVQLVPGDLVLLCTDGLTGVVSSEEISCELRDRAPGDALLHSLIDKAKGRGGPDNITVVLYEHQ